MDSLLTASEVAQRLRCSQSTVYDLIAAGVLPSVRIGRAVRVAAPALSTFIAAGGTQRGGIPSLADEDSRTWSTAEDDLANLCRPRAARCPSGPAEPDLDGI